MKRKSKFPLAAGLVGVLVTGGSGMASAPNASPTMMGMAALAGMQDDSSEDADSSEESADSSEDESATDATAEEEASEDIGTGDESGDSTEADSAGEFAADDSAESAEASEASADQESAAEPKPVAAAPQQRAVPAGVQEIKAHITGVVWKIEQAVGSDVRMGDTVAILESMKMEMPVEADQDGKITEILIRENDQVKEGQVIMRVMPR